MQIDVKAEVDEVIRALGKLDGEIDKAASQSLNDAVRGGRTVAKKLVKEQVGLSKVSDALKYLRFEWAKPHKLVGLIRAPGGKSNRVSLKHLKSTTSKGSLVRWKAGATVQAPRSFQGKGKLNGHYYHRYLPNGGPVARRKIRKLVSRSSGDVLDKAINSEKVAVKMQETFMRRFNHQLDRRLKKLGIRR